MAGYYDHRGEFAQRLGLSSVQDLPEYRVWIDMRRRCRDPKLRNYPNYGGRGIAVCDRWQTFENFYADMGPRPSKRHSIDRHPDNDGNYEPGNCRWATREEQRNNMRNNRWVEYRGRRMSLRDAIRSAGDVIEKSAAWRRLDLGWSIEMAVETPPDPRFHKNVLAARKRLAA